MKIPSTRPFFTEEDITSISRELGGILSSGVLVLGPYTRDFEEAFGRYCGVKHAVAVNSCTAALEIVLRHIDIRGREVIVPTNTFVATANSVIENGGRLVLADMKPSTLCLDPADVRRRLTPSMKAVIVVHIAGLPCPDIEELQSICRENGLILVEDVAHAHGATIDGRKAGSLGYAGCFSFYATKVMTTGAGGMITTDDDALAETARRLRFFGASGDLNRITDMGKDWLMTEVTALLGLYQLRSLETNLARRNEIAARYARLLAGSEDLDVFPVPPNVRHAYYKYPVLLSPDIDKPGLVRMMKTEYAIDLGSVYDPPVHLQPVYQQLHGYGPGMFPEAEKTLGQTCCLPIFPQLADEDVDRVAASLLAALPVCRRQKADMTS